MKRNIVTLILGLSLVSALAGCAQLDCSKTVPELTALTATVTSASEHHETEATHTELHTTETHNTQGHNRGEHTTETHNSSDHTTEMHMNDHH